LKDAVLFAIEVSPSMLQRPPPSKSKKADNDSPTSAALKCAYALMQQRIISNPNDMMGILLYGTQKTKFHDEDNPRGGLAYPNCYLLADLDIPAASDVKALRNLVEDEDEFSKLMVPSDLPVSMANVLFCANQIFATKAANFASRRLFIVTNDDDPHAKDKAQRSAAAVRAKDLYDLGVVIELFPISKKDSEFDRTKFYNDIIYSTSPTDPDAPAPVTRATKTATSGDGISLLQSLISSINSKAVPRRNLFSNLPFEIGPNFKIGVNGYIFFKRQEAKRSHYVSLEGEKPQIVQLETTLITDDTGRTVDKNEVKKAYKFGGDLVIFTKEEISAIRNFGEPVLRIIGFKPMDMVPLWANVKHSTFIYPSEDDYVGSTRVFAALQQKMLKDKKAGIAWFIARKNAAPVIAAVFPGPERRNEEGDQVIPGGMWITPLPYADDIRQNPPTTNVPAPEELIDKMRIIMQNLQLPKAQYLPEKYPNPALQWHYRILQAMALEEDIPEKPIDKTLPKLKQMQQRVGGYIQDWNAELDAQHTIHASATRSESTLAKRPAASAQDGPNKKVKISSSAGDGISDAEMQTHFKKNSIGKLTVAVLKGWCQSKHLDTSGKKGDLVERVEGWFETK
jgi:ATP-dependent DNA helicase 2 subunit 1